MPDDKLHLPERLDGTTASQVCQELLKRRGQPCELHADRVKSVGALGLQTLVSAKKQWEMDGALFNILGGTDVLQKACLQTGIDPSAVGLSNHAEAL